MGTMILVEGLDLAGKSTLVRALEAHYRRLGYSVRTSTNNLCPDNPIAQTASKLVRWDPEFGGEEAGALFLSSQWWDARNFKRPGRGEVHLQDSSWLRSLAYEHVLGKPELAAMMERQARVLPRFDRALYLTASLEERRRRFWSRKTNDLHDHFAFRSPDTFTHIDQKLKKLVCAWEDGIAINTDGLTADQVLDQALSLLEPALAS